MSDNEDVRLPEGEYAKYLASLAGNIADEKAQKRETRWRALIGVGVTAIALLGFANLQSIQATLKESIENAESNLEAKIDRQLPISVRAYVESNKSEILGTEITRLQEELESRLALLQLVITASEMRRGDGFTRETRGAVVALLQKVSSNPDIVTSNEFTKPLEDIVDSFLAADQEPYIDDIDEKLRQVISERGGIVSSMLQHYGLRVVGSAELNKETVERFLHYATLSEQVHNSPENAAPFRLGYEYIASGGARTAAAEAILQDALYWTGQERSNFLKFTEILASGLFTRRITGKTQRTQETISKVRELYEKEFSDLESSIQRDDVEDTGQDERELLRMMLERKGATQ